MTTFVYTWNATFLGQPQDIEDESLGAQRIRDTKAATGERLAVDHSLAGDSDDGKHQQVTLMPASSSAVRPLDANNSCLFQTLVSANAELFYQDSSGRVLQFTNAGLIASAFPSGTIMVFVQPAPPAGWTLLTGYDDFMLRIYNATAGQGSGSWTISGLSVGGHTLSIGEIPAHSHTYTVPQGSGTGSGGTSLAPNSNVNTYTSANAGGGGAHDHPLSADGTWRPRLIDTILAQKS